MNWRTIGLLVLTAGAVLVLNGTAQTNVYNPNPLYLDSKGEARVFFSPESYRLILMAPPHGGTNETLCNGMRFGKVEWDIERAVRDPRHPENSALQRFVKADGSVAAGYVLCTYKAGTTTPLATYSAPWKPEPKPVQREDCEKYYDRAKHRIDSPNNGQPYNPVDLYVETTAYATMFLACRERNR